MQINKIILLGYVGKNPEMNYFSEDNFVAKFPLATNESYKNNKGERIETTQWHTIVLWKKLAEIAEKYIQKGMQLYVEGRLTYQIHTSKEGKTVSRTEIIGEKITLGQKKQIEKNVKIETIKNENNQFTVNKFDDLPF